MRERVCVRERENQRDIEYVKIEIFVESSIGTRERERKKETEREFICPLRHQIVLPFSRSLLSCCDF